MRTVDQLRIHAPIERVLQSATNVEQWPAILPHYRWVRVLERHADQTVVEMAAWRPFGRLNYPTWWISEMWVDQATPAVHYRHVRGITTGMDVVWRLRPAPDGTEVTIVHEWDGPRWPLIGPLAASWVIGPVFIHGIASRTLAGIARYLERQNDGIAERRNGGRSMGPEAEVPTFTRSDQEI